MKEWLCQKERYLVIDEDRESKDVATLYLSLCIGLRAHAQRAQHVLAGEERRCKSGDLSSEL